MPSKSIRNVLAGTEKPPRSKIANILDENDMMYRHRNCFQAIIQNDALVAPVRDPRKSDTMVTPFFNALLSLAVIAYSVYALVLFINRPEIIEIKTVPMTNFNQDVMLQVHVACSGPAWKCTANATKPNGTTTWLLGAGPSISEVSGGGLETDLANETAAVLSPTGHQVVLDYSPRKLDGLYIKAPGFTSNCDYGDAACPSLQISITGGTGAAGEVMQSLITLEPHQRKAVYVGLVVTRHSSRSALSMSLSSTAEEFTGVTTYNPFQADMYYEGKNADKSAQLVVRLAQFATVSETRRPGSLLEVFASIGGAASLLTVLLKVVHSLVCACLIRRKSDALPDFDGPPSGKEEEEGERLTDDIWKEIDR